MITGYVKGQALSLSAPVLAADTIDYLTARFVFSSREWDGLDIWAHFALGDTQHDCRLDEKGEITADQHLNLSAGAWKVHITGHLYRDGALVQRITTVQADLEVRPSGVDGYDPFPEMPGGVTDGILAQLDDHGKRISELENDPGGSGGISDAVQYIPQELTEEQQMQARANIGAASAEEVDKLSETIADHATVDGNVLKMQKTTTDEDGRVTTTDLFEVELPVGGEGWTIDGLTAENALADDDTVPFYDTSAKAQKKTLWSNIKAVLKNYFDTTYLKLTGGTITGNLSLNGNLIMPFGSYGIRDNTDNPIFRYETINDEACLRIGQSARRLYFYSSERPMYNGRKFALSDEIPDAYDKTYIDAIMGSYITDINALVGGEE